jgi:hypothetical protein
MAYRKIKGTCPNHHDNKATYIGGIIGGTNFSTQTDLRKFTKYLHHFCKHKTESMFERAWQFLTRLITIHCLLLWYEAKN